MKLKLIRSQCGATCTIGRLFISGVEECFVLEDVDRQLEDNPDAKIAGQTCIPRGTYKVIIDYSNRFKRELPRLLSVPGFEGIRIHPGNGPENTEGCLLPGEAVAESGDRLIYSRIAFDRLFAKMERAYAANEDIEIEVR